MDRRSSNVTRSSFPDFGCCGQLQRRAARRLSLVPSFIISRAPAQHAASCAVAAASRRSSTRMGSTGKSRAICFAVFAFWRCARVRLNMVLLRCTAPRFFLRLRPAAPLEC